MSEFKEIPVQHLVETHVYDDGASAANVCAKPMMTAPRSLFKKHGRKAVRVARLRSKPIPQTPPTHSQKRSLEAASPAIQPTKPSGGSPGTLSKLPSREAGRAAVVRAKPSKNTPPEPLQKRSPTAASPAKKATKPRDGLPGTFSPTRGRHEISETHNECATASPAIENTKPITQLPGNSSRWRHGNDTPAVLDIYRVHVGSVDHVETGRCSIAPAKPRTIPIGENSEGQRHAETQNVVALNGRATDATKPNCSAPDLPICDGHDPHETQRSHAVAGDDHAARETQDPNVIATVIKRSRKAAGPAIVKTKPTVETPGILSTNRDRKVARRSMDPPKPTELASGENSEGHTSTETHPPYALNGRARLNAKPSADAPDLLIRDGQHRHETQGRAAVAGDDQSNIETQGGNVIAPVIVDIQEQWRRRQAWHRAEKSLTLTASAICRRTVGARGLHKEMNKSDKAKNKILLRQAAEMLERIETHTTIDGDKRDEAAALSCVPILVARDAINERRKSVEKDIAKLARSLPVWPWVKSIYGAAELTLYAVVGECGDVGSYKSVSAVWKRMGLAVIEGQRQRRVTGPDALLHGYSPKRRSVAWNIGGGLIGGMGKGPRPKVGEDIELRDDWSPYQKQFVRLLRQEVERVTDTWNGPEHRRDPVERKGEIYESFSSHASNRIKRRIEKQFLAELYGAWRGENR